MLRNVTSSNVAAQAVDASGVAPKKLAMAAAANPICENQPRMGSWKTLAVPLTASIRMHFGRSIAARGGLAVKARIVSR